VRRTLRPLANAVIGRLPARALAYVPDEVRHSDLDRRVRDFIRRFEAAAKKLKRYDEILLIKDPNGANYPVMLISVVDAAIARFTSKKERTDYLVSILPEDLHPPALARMAALTAYRDTEGDNDHKMFASIRAFVKEMYPDVYRDMLDSRGRIRYRSIVYQVFNIPKGAVIPDAVLPYITPEWDIQESSNLREIPLEMGEDDVNAITYENFEPGEEVAILWDAGRRTMAPADVRAHHVFKLDALQAWFDKRYSEGHPVTNPRTGQQIYSSQVAHGVLQGRARSRSRSPRA
jgi:hypothetical protein